MKINLCDSCGNDVDEGAAYVLKEDYHTTPVKEICRTCWDEWHDAMLDADEKATEEKTKRYRKWIIRRRQKARKAGKILKLVVDEDAEC